jgi:hypothetical protein
VPFVLVFRRGQEKETVIQSKNQVPSHEKRELPRALVGNMKKTEIREKQRDIKKSSGKEKQGRKKVT